MQPISESGKSEDQYYIWILIPGTSFVNILQIIILLGGWALRGRGNLVPGHTLTQRHQHWLLTIVIPFLIIVLMPITSPPTPSLWPARYLVTAKPLPAHTTVSHRHWLDANYWIILNFSPECLPDSKPPGLIASWLVTDDDSWWPGLLTAHSSTPGHWLQSVGGRLSSTRQSACPLPADNIINYAVLEIFSEKVGAGPLYCKIYLVKYRTQCGRVQS